ncbi:MAG: tRNA pseudouridine(55) synthase TruB [Myxococcales bacterium]|nr:tRNA pseudouridine(55) synthase TruB [Myxococcales bacterium]
MNGILLVDKPAGCTSHDVVQRVRKAIQQRSVGHAGTLDPLATGVLVVAIGEGTKLVPYLQSEDKRYEVTIALGAETDSLDADGTVTERAEVPLLDRERVYETLAQFVGRHSQEAPKLSAIKVGGIPLHRRARRGEDVQAPIREVVLLEASVEGVGPDELRLKIHCGKGFYVRSLARDLARALGTVGHVTRLRRTASGSFDLSQALDGGSITEEAVADHLIPVSEACGALTRVDLLETGVEHARHGRRIATQDISGGAWREAATHQPLALFGPDGEVVALGRRQDDGVCVVRGFVRNT